MAFSQIKQRVCAVISAAGLSSRMGDFKPLMPFGGETVAARCMENLRRAGVDEIIVVTGYRGEELRAEVAGPGVRFVENPDFRTTQMFDSLRIGMAALPADCSRVVLQPVDMPAIRPETVAALLRTESAAVRPVCRGKGGHPLVLDAALVPQLAAYDGSGGLRGALETLGIEVTDVPTEDEGTLLDADTKDDYVNLLRLEETRRPRRVYLFRHGLPAFPNGVHLCLGLTPDLPLSEAGKTEAARWTAVLKEKRITGIYSSPALRCRETAAALSGGAIPAAVCPELHEMCYGEWEGLDFGEIRSRYAELYARRETDMSLMPPGGEPMEEAAHRGLAALMSLMNDTAGDIAIVAHAGLNRALLWQLSGSPVGKIRAYQQDYLHLSVLRYENGSFKAGALNQSADEFIKYQSENEA